MSAQDVRLLHQHHLLAGLGRKERRVQAGETTADDQDPVRHLLDVRYGQTGVLHPGGEHPKVVFGQPLGVLVVGLVAPHHVLTQVDAIHQNARIGELGLLFAHGAGRDADVVDPVRVDVALDHRAAFFAAQKFMALADRGLDVARSELLHRLQVEGVTDTAAGADVHS